MVKGVGVTVEVAKEGIQYLPTPNDTGNCALKHGLSS